MSKWVIQNGGGIYIINNIGYKSVVVVVVIDVAFTITLVQEWTQNAINSLLFFTSIRHDKINSCVPW